MAFGLAAGAVGIPTPPRKDPDLQKQIWARVKQDPVLPSDIVNVVVLDGVVNLVGSVGSLAEKRSAVQDATVDGVLYVDDSSLRIDPEIHDTLPVTDTVTGLGDASIAIHVRDSFFKDPRVNPSSVQILVENGTVILSGSVDDLAAQSAALSDTRNSVGVRRVVNQIQVSPPQNITDSQIKQGVRQVLTLDPLLKHGQVTTRVDDGVVTLSGTVPSGFERSFVEDDASRIAGVIAIDNRLKIG